MIIKEERIGGQRLILGDCMNVMPLLERFDLCLTDPPYGIAENYLKPSTKGEWSKLYSEQITWDNFAPKDALMEALTLSSWSGIVWGGNYFPLPPVRGWLIWDKMQWHSSGHAELAWSSLDIPIRSFAYSRAQLSTENKQHPTQKPVALMEWCLGFLPNATTILDPFMGSGTTLVACQRMGRNGTGIELDEEYWRIACERVHKAWLEPDLFIADTKPTAPQQESFLDV